MDNLIAQQLRMIAGKAAILAERYEKSQLWPGELTEGCADIQRALDDAKQGERR